jgi:predicted RNA-binding protein
MSNMDMQQRELLEDLRNALKNGFLKECVDAFLKEPSAAAITKEALKQLKGSINESD